MIPFFSPVFQNLGLLWSPNLGISFHRKLMGEVEKAYDQNGDDKWRQCSAKDLKSEQEIKDKVQDNSK